MSPQAALLNETLTSPWLFVGAGSVALLFAILLVWVAYHP